MMFELANLSAESTHLCAKSAQLLVCYLFLLIAVFSKKKFKAAPISQRSLSQQKPDTNVLSLLLYLYPVNQPNHALQNHLPV